MSLGRSLIVGGGAVGSKFHAPRILGLGNCPELHIVEVSEHRREALRAQFRKEPRVFVTGQLPAGEFDLGVIATPPKFHLENYLALGGKCSNVVVEKPLAKTPDEARTLVTAAASEGVKVYVGLIRRGLENLSLVANWIDSGLYGPLRSVSIAEGLVFSWNPVSLGSFSRELNGGGVVMDTGPHTFDQVRQIFPNAAVRAAWLDAIAVGQSQVIEANALIELDCGEISCTMQLSRNRSLSNTAIFEFDKASVTVGLHSEYICVCDRNGNALEGTPAGVTQTMDYDGLFDAFYHRFVLSRCNDGVDASDSVAVQDLIASVYDKAEMLPGVF